MRLDIIETFKSTSDSISIRFAKPFGLKYKAGQYGQFNFAFNGERVLRTYSFNSSPDVDSEIEITVKGVENGVVSQRLLKQQIDSVELETIGGKFFIDMAHESVRHLIMFAGGSGITPIISMIRFVLRNEPLSMISLLYSNSYSDNIIFKKELQDLQTQSNSRFKVYFVITREEASSEELTIYYKGRLSKLIIKKFLKNLMAENNGDTEYYLCGPNPFMILMEESIKSVNTGKLRIFKEHFFIPENEAAKFDLSNFRRRQINIELRNDKKRLMVEAGKSILEAALENNISLAYSCTEGQCGLCRSLLVSGEVKLRKNHVLTEEEIKQGLTLLCQAFPVSDDVAILPLN